MSTLKDTYFFTPHNQSYQTKDLGLSSTTIVTKAYQSGRTLQNGKSADCAFCGDEFKKGSKLQFHGMVTKALYAKYSSSQNYYYSKDVNEILGELRTPAVFLFKDYLHFDEEDEYLKRFYNADEHEFKMKMLAEYYKFHNDVARLFMMPMTNIVNKFHDKKRRLEYIRVTKMLQEEQDVKDGVKPKVEEEKKKIPKDFILTDRILDELDLTDPEVKKQKAIGNKIEQSPYVHRHMSPDKKTPIRKVMETPKILTIQKGAVVKHLVNDKEKEKQKPAKDLSVSNTLFDLNLKLGEIINSSTQNFDSNYLNTSTNKTDETMSNLTSFLIFMNNKQKNVKTETNPNTNSSNFRSKPTYEDHRNEKVAISMPLTERILRPEHTMSTSRTRQTPVGDLIIKASEPYNKVTTPTTFSKLAIRSSKNFEKLKEKYGEKSTATWESLFKTKSSATLANKGKITQRPDLEEALRVNMQNYQQKMAHVVPRDQLLTKVLSMNTTSKQRANSGTSTKLQGQQYFENKFQELSVSRRKTQLDSNPSPSHIRTKTKTKSSDISAGMMNSQVGLNKNSKRESTTTNGHSHTRSSINSKATGPSYQMYEVNERSSGKEDLKIDFGMIPTNLKILSSRGHTDFVYAQTERESKRTPNFENLMMYKRDNHLQVPLTERTLYKNKNHARSSSKSGVKDLRTSTEQPQGIQYKTMDTADGTRSGLHKYTKSEDRLKRPELVERFEQMSSTRLALNNGSNTSRSQVINVSPKRQYLSNANNGMISSAFLASQRSDRKPIRKPERQLHNGELLLNYKENESMSKISRVSPGADFIRLSQQLPRKLNLDFSPQKNGALLGHPKAMSSRSSSSVNTRFSRKVSKNEYESARRDL